MVSWQQYAEPLGKDKVFLAMREKKTHTVLHEHNFLEITYITRGTVIHTLNGTKSILKQGNFAIVDYRSVHSYQTKGNSTYDNYDCLFLPEFLDPLLRGTESLSAIFEHYLLHFNMQALTQNPAHMIFHDSDGKILSILKKMHHEYEMRKPGWKEMLRCHLVELLLLTIRQLDNASIASESKNIITHIVAYINENYMEPLTLKFFAEQMNYSLSHLSKEFKKTMGVSFVAYLQNHRIMQSCRLLISTKKSIAEISNSVGYSDIKFYTHLFKQITGVPPSKFRKQHKQ